MYDVRLLLPSEVLDTLQCVGLCDEPCVHGVLLLPSLLVSTSLVAHTAVVERGSVLQASFQQQIARKRDRRLAWAQDGCRAGDPDSQTTLDTSPVDIYTHAHREKE